MAKVSGDSEAREVNVWTSSSSVWLSVPDVLARIVDLEIGKSGLGTRMGSFGKGRRGVEEGIESHGEANF